MKKSDFKTLTSPAILLSLALAGTASAGVTAEQFPFRVAFESVPGVDAITSGNVTAGVAELESALQAGQVERGMALTTLCGAYILMGALESAERTCERAVTEQPSKASFNNRGVLRAFIGDYSGARRDFDRARPEQMDAYLASLRTRDAALIASDNHRLVNRLQARSGAPESEKSIAFSGSAGTNGITP